MAQITINIPDAFVSRIQAAFQGEAPKQVVIKYLKKKVLQYETVQQAQTAAADLSAELDNVTID